MGAQGAQVVVDLDSQRAVRDLEPGLGEPGSWTWDVLPWGEDVWCRRMVRDNPDGMGLREIAEALGIPLPTVQMILRTAARKLLEE